MVTIDGAPVFVVTDVCRALAIHVMPNGDVNSTSAVKKLAPDESAFYRIAGSPGTPARTVRVISESGLYKLVMRSDKPEARAFRD